MEQIIIFCSAPSDIQYALSIYEENTHEDISMFCLNVEGIYKFLYSLNLSLKELTFIPYPVAFSTRKPIYIFNERRRLKRLYNKYFAQVKGSDVYFFSHFYDWMTFAFISRLVKYNEVYFIDHYDTDGSQGGYIAKNISLKKKAWLFLMKYITDIRFQWFLTSDKTYKLRFPFERYGIKRLVAPVIPKEIFEKYSYNQKYKENAVLLFDSNEQDLLHYREIMKDIVQRLKEKGFNIVIKPHPRLGYMKMLEQLTDEMIPSHIPGEFINVHSFSAILGTFTVAIAKLAKNGVRQCYSILEIFEHEDDRKREMFRHYLSLQSEDKLNFVYSIEELLECIHQS